MSIAATVDPTRSACARSVPSRASFSRKVAVTGLDNPMLTRPFPRSHWRFSASASRKSSSRSEGVAACVTLCLSKARQAARPTALAFRLAWVERTGSKVDEGSRQQFRLGYGGETASRERAVRAQAGQRDEIDVTPTFQLRLDRGAPTRSAWVRQRQRVAILCHRFAQPAYHARAQHRVDLQWPQHHETPAFSQADNTKACLRAASLGRRDPISAPAMGLKASGFWRRLFKSRPFLGQGVDHLQGRGDA